MRVPGEAVLETDMPQSTPSLDWLSPLPPVRSGISDYTVDLLPHLETRCDVRVVRLPGQPVSDEIETRWSPVPVERLGDDGRLPVYQMGNNRYHEDVLRTAMDRPGVVTLHDLVIHHQLLDMTLGRSDNLEPYEERLTRDHGWIGAPVARAKLWGAYGQMPTFALPAHRTLLRRQRGVLVHNRWAAETILDDDPEIRVRVVPMGVPLPDAADPEAGRAFRRERGIPEEAPLLGCFGFQTPIKRTLSAIRALARPELSRAHLLIVGEVSPALDLETEARELGVADRVHVTGFVEFSELERSIAAADLCLNLRYPTAGETSASLLRILAVGRPAVVSDYAQFAELPDEAVVKVPLGDREVELLATTLAELLDDPDRLHRMGEAAREHVRREHDPGRAADAVVEACREWREAEPPGDAHPDPAPPTTLAWSELPSKIEIEGAELPWPDGERRRLTIRLHNPGPATWLAGETGPGGVALEVAWALDDGRREGERPWRPLPRSVPSGESVELHIDTRRPPGEARLVVEPHVMGGRGFGARGGPERAASDANGIQVLDNVFARGANPR